MNQKRKKLIAIMLLSMYLLSYMAITPIVASIYHDFPNTSLEHIQIIVTFIPLFSVITMFLCTPLSKKISMKHIGALGLCFIAIGGIIPVLFHRYLWQVYLSSILLGLGTGLVNVISSTLISYYFTGTDKMKVMGYQSVFVSVGGTLFSYLSGILATIHWTTSYLCYLTALFAIVILLSFLPNDKLVQEKKIKKKLPLRLYWLGIISILFFIALNIFNTSVAVLLEDLGYSSQISSLATALYTLIGIIAGMILNKIVKVMKQHTLTFACFLATIALLLISLNQVIFIFIGSALLGFSFASRNPAGITFSANMVEEEQSAFAIAIFNGAGQFGCFLSPYVIRILQTPFSNGMATSFFIAAMIMAVVTLLHFVLNPIQKDDMA